MSDNIFNSEVLLNEHQASKLFGLTPRWFQKKRLEGGGPPFIRISSRCIRYQKKSLLDWAESYLVTSTSQMENKP